MIIARWKKVEQVKIIGLIIFILLLEIITQNLAN